MKDVYVIDACSLINAAHNYNMNKKTFSHIWEKLSEKIETQELISSVEVFDELKDDDLVGWTRKHKEMFVPLNQEIQEKTVEILKTHPTLIKMKSVANSNADPFLIATAIINNGIVITDEGRHGIPSVCADLGIKCINLNEYFDIIFE